MFSRRLVPILACLLLAACYTPAQREALPRAPLGPHGVYKVGEPY